MGSGKRNPTCVPGIDWGGSGRFWIHNAKREASALVCMWTAHTYLSHSSSVAQCMPYNRMLQYIAAPTSEEWKPNPFVFILG